LTRMQKQSWKRCGIQLEDSVIFGMDDWQMNNFGSKFWKAWKDLRSLAKTNEV